MTLGLKEYLLIALFVFLCLCAWKFYHAGEKAASNKIETKSLTEASHVREKENEIRNNRPDEPALVGRLRAHTF